MKLSSAHLACVFALLLAATPAVAQSVRPYRPAVDVLDYRFALTLPDTGHAFEGEAAIRFVRTAPTDTLVLDLVGLAVQRVHVAGRVALCRQDSATLRIALPPHASRDTLVAMVRYAGTPAEGLKVSRDSAGRWQVFGDNWPERARHWLPTVDHPSDKATVSWAINVPSERTVVANGALVGVEDVPAPPGGTPRRVTRWREGRPISTYLMVIAAARLARVDLGDTACGLAELTRCVRQSVYVAPELVGFAPVSFRSAGDIVRFFGSLVAPYPYEKLDHVQSSGTQGGMENASAIFYGDLDFRRGRIDRSLVAHEIAHQWFGNAVTAREWAHVWLSEGISTYWDHLYIQQIAGDSAYRESMRQRRAEIISAPEVAARPVIDTAETKPLNLLNPNSYQKGAWTLHMLRGMLGDSAFFRGIRAYYTAHLDGTALTDDLRSALEASGGRPLGWFFDQWLRRPGFPELTVVWRHDATTQRVRLTITQGPRFAPYRFPLDLELVDPAGRAQRVTVDVPAEREVTRTLEVRSVAAPREVRLDPDVRLLGTFAVTGS